MGYDVCDIPTFHKLCSKWDIINNISGNQSTNNQLFYNNGGDDGCDNIFGFVLKNHDIYVRFKAYDFHEEKPDIPTSAIGVIFFNNGHTWSIRRHQSDNKWWIHDSMRIPRVYRHNPRNRVAALYCFLK